MVILEENIEGFDPPLEQDELASNPGDVITVQSDITGDYQALMALKRCSEEKKKKTPTSTNQDLLDYLEYVQNQNSVESEQLRKFKQIQIAFNDLQDNPKKAVKYLEDMFKKHRGISRATLNQWAENKGYTTTIKKRYKRWRKAVTIEDLAKYLLATKDGHLDAFNKVLIKQNKPR